MSAYGEIIRVARKKAGLTQKQVAAHVGCTHVYVCQVEKGYRQPFSRHRNLLLSELLKVEFETLEEAARQWEEKQHE